MTIRLAVVCTGDTAGRILQALERAAGDSLSVVLRIGDGPDALDAAALSRMRIGRTTAMLARQRWTGAAAALIESPEFQDRMEEFVDHLHRRGESSAYRSHPLRTMQDYADFYLILADAIGQMLVERGVTHCLFFSVPHLAYDTILYQMAKALGIATTILSPALFPDRFFSMSDVADMGDFPADPLAAPHAMEPGTRPDLFYMRGIKQEAEAAGRLTPRALAQLVAFLALKRPLRALNPVYVWRMAQHMQRVYGAFPKWRDPFARFFHEDALDYFDHLAGFETQEVDLSGDYVYFPLQLQPELTTAALGGRFRDQAYAIECLARILPPGVRILVKENPKQGAYMRGPMFFHRLRRIPSVTFLPSWANTHALTDGARFVATVTGTVGWEAIRTGKPALVFGKSWFRKLPGVVEWHDGIGYDQIAATRVDHAELERAVGALLARCHPGVLTRHFKAIVPGFDPEANAGRTARAVLDLIQGRQALTFPGRPSAG